jgi:hypothetical protein
MAFKPIQLNPRRDVEALESRENAYLHDYLFNKNDNIRELGKIGVSVSYNSDDPESADIVVRKFR